MIPYLLQQNLEDIITHHGLYQCMLKTNVSLNLFSKIILCYHYLVGNPVLVLKRLPQDNAHVKLSSIRVFDVIVLNHIDVD